MESLIEMRREDNYHELLRAGLDAARAKLIAAVMAMKVILEIAISDLGVHLGYWDNEVKLEKKVVLKFDL